MMIRVMGKLKSINQCDAEDSSEASLRVVRVFPGLPSVFPCGTSFSPAVNQPSTTN